jgi:SP family arabinose:H+ symporter-like MFS transporter
MKIAATGTEEWNIEMGWRYMFGSELIPASLFFIALFFVPESPRWLTKQGKEDEALSILEKVNGIERAKEVLAEVKETLLEETGSLKELLAPGFRTALIVGVVLAMFSQITGINAIIYYAPEIFKSVGFGTDSALFQTVIIGTTNTIFTFIAIWLIDKVGRRPLLLWGVSGMTVCLFGVGMLFYFEASSGPWLLIFILGFVGSFSASLGPIPWVLISEIFPTKIRGVAMSIATFTLWIGVILITQLTPILMDWNSAFTFWIFMINAIILVVFTYKMIPETKGKTLEEIEHAWKSGF